MALDFGCEPNIEQHSDAILFIHSLFHNGIQAWKNVSEFLNNAPYYKLKPTIQPADFSDINNTILRLANLIRSATTNRTAHVVGLSVGAHIAIKLAQSYPDVVSSLVVSGYRICSRIARPLTWRYIFLRTNVCRKVGPVFSPRQSRSIARLFVLPTNPEPFRKRTMIIVASYCDRPKDARALQEVLSGYGNRVDIKTIKPEWELGHLWNLEDSKLFAHVVSSWARDEWPEELNKWFLDISNDCHLEKEDDSTVNSTNSQEENSDSDLEGHKQCD